MTALPDSADTIVIGGGAMGASTLYHLAKLGRRPVLLERDQLTSGTTWHSAAQVRQLRSSENLTRLIQYSAKLYGQLEEETGQATGWLQSGSLSIATNRDRLVHIKRQASLANLFGIATDVVSAKTAADYWPLMRTDDVIGAVYSPSDGRVNPSDLTAALIKGARQLGATVYEHTPVERFAIDRNGVAGVHTSRGYIACNQVVICAGLWSRAVALLAGAIAPLHACEHFYLLTQPIDGGLGHLPTLGDHDGHLYIRDDVGGLLVGSFEPNARPVGLESLPADFSFDLLDEDWTHFEPMLENAMHRIPALEHASTRMLLNGPESFTPDGAFLLGESPDVRGLFFGCGMNSMGLASSGGAGWALASWIVEGRAAFDLSPVDIRRFSPMQNALSYVRERAREVLSMHYAIDYPGRELSSGRGLRRSPIHTQLEAAGAVFGERSGWERATWYRTEAGLDERLTFGRPGWDALVAQEHAAARNAVALFDQTSFGKLLVHGPNALDELQRLCSNDVDIPVGRCVYALLLNARGGIESDVTIQRLGLDEFLLFTGTSQLVRDLHWLRSHIEPTAHVLVTDVTSSWAVFGVAGPLSRALLATVCESDVSNEAFPYYSFQTIEIGGVPVRAVRMSYAGGLGWELNIPAESAAAVYETLIANGEALGLKHAGTMALTSLRIERGFRAWGHDMTPDDSPYVAGLDFVVKPSKAESFIGAGALSDRRADAQRARLCSFVLDDPDVRIQGGEPVVCNGAYVGQVTSATFGYSLGRAVGLASVRSDSSVEALVQSGGFSIEFACEQHPATFSLKPPYDPHGAEARR